MTWKACRFWYRVFLADCCLSVLKDFSLLCVHVCLYFCMGGRECACVGRWFLGEPIPAGSVAWMFQHAVPFLIRLLALHRIKISALMNKSELPAFNHRG